MQVLCETPHHTIRCTVQYWTMVPFLAIFLVVSPIEFRRWKGTNNRAKEQMSKTRISAVSSQVQSQSLLQGFCKGGELLAAQPSLLVVLLSCSMKDQSTVRYSTLYGITEFVPSFCQWHGSDQYLTTSSKRGIFFVAHDGLHLQYISPYEMLCQPWYMAKYSSCLATNKIPSRAVQPPS